ncbi:MAG: SatD family protein [Spirochaetales bacterium]
MQPIVIIADIVGSRRIPGRSAFQQRLGKTLEQINADAGAALLSPYTITLGDEFQAVYSRFAPIFQNLVAIAWRCYPEKIRFAVNAGPIATEINPTAAVGMDGPAFHGARAAIERMKKIDETVIVVQREGASIGPVYDAALRVLSIYLNGLGATALGALALYSRGAELATMVAETGVKQRAVYKAMDVNYVREHWQLFEALSREIEQEFERQHASWYESAASDIVGA